MRRALLAIALVLLPSPAAGFTDDLLLSDRELTDHTAMSLADVQQFLAERHSTLAATYLPDSTGALKFPSEIIWTAALEAQVNPQVLLTMLQKEQRLIADPAPSSRQVDFAMGYGCPDGSGCSDRFKGFGKQVRGAALQLRGYLDDLLARNETIARWAIGRTKQTGDGIAVTPRNAATAALYSYTPWRGGIVGENGRRIGGNLSFTRIWRQWFGSGAWPDGTVLEDPNGVHWLLQSGKRRKLASPAVIRARLGAAAAVVAPQTDIEAYAEGGPIRFPEYAIVEGPDGIRWLLVGDTRRRITSREVFRKLGFHPEEVETASMVELAAYGEGAPIVAAREDPRGVLVQERETKRVYHVVGTTKALVVDPAIQRVRFGVERPIMRTTKELRTFTNAPAVRFPDGAITTAPTSLPTVFIISRGERRPFASARALELLGYQWSNVLHVSDAALALHPLGRAVGEDRLEEVVPQPVAPLPQSAPAATPEPPPVIRWHNLSLF